MKTSSPPNMLFIILLFSVLISSVISLQLGQTLSFASQWLLLKQPALAHAFPEIQFVYAQLPRVVMAILVGATLGLTGSVMQQLTQNPLTSPLTLGTSSGAWLALIIVHVFFSNWVADYSAIAAMTGALLAFALVLLITGLRNMTGLSLIVSGMVINILLGALAGALILLNEQFAQNIFMWGAGDLAQNGWNWVNWLWPRLVIALPVLIFAPRCLSLLRLGQQGAAARGLAVIPIFLALIIGVVWLVSAAITAVGVISFIGLLSPNIARALGARTPKAELYASLLLGAVLLLVTDLLSMWLSQFSGEVIPSGITAALIGAPALIVLSRRHLKTPDKLIANHPQQPHQLRYGPVIAILTMLLLATGLHFFLQAGETTWQWIQPDAYQWEIRLPRALTALSTGVALAMAGVVLQRLIHNPLASPDILGVSSGATFALILGGLGFEQSALSAHWSVALLGSLLVLLILLGLGRRHQYAPLSLILTGIAITALLEALIQLCLIKGNADSYRILLWLSGSTYRTTLSQSLTLTLGISLLAVLALCFSRYLTLMSLGRDFAAARGLNPQITSLILLFVVALFAALATASMGPVVFVGLVAPHMAMLLGAARARAQLLLAALLGATLMLWADWLAQVVIYPMQIATGTLVALLGGTYFLLLMLSNRLR